MEALGGYSPHDESNPGFNVYFTGPRIRRDGLQGQER